MILYHGGTEAVTQPDCKAGRPDLDFGQGFYVTLLQNQAVLDKYLKFVKVIEL